MKTFELGRRLPLLLLLLGASCGASNADPFQRLPVADPRPDFALEDLNPSSATHSQVLGPSSLRGSVSAWYFGHST